ncbi:protein FAM76A-like isoform X2 [Macrobrachium rosenbergii]|uniref:protein FAM76A-like isoform X2 n=1 Tax=Macrobrachium rosenbergii TaxID=79674 RepID=UPI0034D41F63
MSALFACSRCFSRHPFEELSQGQQLCKTDSNEPSMTEERRCAEDNCEELLFDNHDHCIIHAKCTSSGMFGPCEQCLPYLQAWTEERDMTALKKIQRRILVMKKLKNRNPSLPDWVSDDIRIAYEVPRVQEEKNTRCRECRGSFPIVKCTYCRSEFQQESKSSTVTICKKCESMVKQYGKPSACEYCNVIAAFIGSKCQRCTNSERKYGPPLTCDQCKQKCAFDRKDIDKKKVDGKVLCWLCTLSYKRALAKTKVTDPARHSHIKLGSRSGHHKDKERPKLSGHNKRPNRPDVTKIPQEEPQAKVSRNSGQVRDDPGTADQLVLITQLREHIANLEKQLSGKDAQLLAKEKQMTELKASQFTVEQELRQKMKTVTRDYESKVELLQKKIREQSREIAILSKGKKKGEKGAALSTTDGGSSGTDSPSVG